MSDVTLLTGAVWRLVGSMLFWGKLVLDMEPDSDQLMAIALAHLAYGLVLGVLGAAVPHLV